MVLVGDRVVVSGNQAGRITLHTFVFLAIINQVCFYLLSFSKAL